MNQWTNICKLLLRSFPPKVISVNKCRSRHQLPPPMAQWFHHLVPCLMATRIHPSMFHKILPLLASHQQCIQRVCNSRLLI
uniref:HACL1 n=1 Tax=Arundo donax TaxID=35708 RepID=A0A0A9HT90_ARUDO